MGLGWGGRRNVFGRHRKEEKNEKRCISISIKTLKINLKKTEVLKEKEKFHIDRCIDEVETKRKLHTTGFCCLPQYCCCSTEASLCVVCIQQEVMTLTCVHSILTPFLLQNRKPSVFISMTLFLPDLGEKLFFIHFFLP